jgi:hypothetical protein
MNHLSLGGNEEASKIYLFKKQAIGVKASKITSQF